MSKNTDKPGTYDLNMLPLDYTSPHKNGFWHESTKDTYATLCAKVDDHFGGWPARADVLACFHGDHDAGRIMKFYSREFHNDVWWTSVLTDTEYYRHKCDAPDSAVITAVRAADVKRSRTKQNLERDPIRQLVKNRAEELHLSIADMSRAVSRSETYIWDYLQRGTPKVLPEQIREPLARLLRVPESMLCTWGQNPAPQVAPSPANLALNSIKVDGPQEAIPPASSPGIHVAFHGQRPQLDADTDLGMPTVSTDNPTSVIPLTRLPAELYSRTGKRTTYARCHTAIINGLLPATQNGRRWQIAEADIRLAAEVLGLVAIPEMRRPACLTV